uniref:Glycoside hydrolase family 19 catalytic domain-containing protein n=1 Tax=Physcomitrium patens TaxID=3218 RepID=A0A2K1KWG0_PHYPA|nr:hypothetical protein PHYPA_005108 [Physcomitrium patens]
MTALVLSLVQGASAEWSSFITKADFDQKYFPGHISFYTYDSLKAAAGTPFTQFGNSGSPEDQKRELALAICKRAGLKQQYEQNCNIQCKQGYCDTTSPYPCSKTQEPYYFGRGPIQLFWNYNYGACGDYIGKRLLQVPGQISTNPVIAFQTAFWFWMTQGSHRFILAKSFSGTTRAINGGYSEEGRRQMLSRVAYYKSFCTILGVDPGTDLEC